MELTGEHRIAAPRSVVWAALHDPELLKACIKGCKSLEMVGPDSMTATVQAKVGPVTATFDANVAIENSVPPESYRLSGEGKGGVAGFAKGFADVSLAEDGDSTILSYHADAKIGGKLAQLGQRLVDTTARKYAADFFDAFSSKLNAGDGQADVSHDPAVSEHQEREPALATPSMAAPSTIAPAAPAPRPATPTAAAPAQLPPSRPASIKAGSPAVTAAMFVAIVVIAAAALYFLL